MTNFEKAFAEARKAGKKEFTWNGKRFNTKLKEDVAKSNATVRPKAKPAGHGMPKVDSEVPKPAMQPKAKTTTVRVGVKKPFFEKSKKARVVGFIDMKSWKKK